MPTTDRIQLARDCYLAYVSGDRSVVENLLSDDFTFFSPPDPGIDRAAYFERCWPNAGTTDSFDFVRLVENGDEVIVTYELTKTADNRVFIRYLPTGVPVGTKTPYLTIGTYPAKQAFPAIKRTAARPGGVSVKIDRGGLLVFNASTPKSVYFSYPKSGYQVEVYDPSPQQARTLVLDGKITPIN